MQKRTIVPVTLLILAVGLVIVLLALGSPIPWNRAASDANNTNDTNTAGSTAASNTTPANANTTPAQSEMVLLPPGASKPVPSLGLIVTVESATVEPCAPTTNTNESAQNTNATSPDDCAARKANIGVAVIVTGNGQQAPGEPKRIVFGTVPSTQTIDQYTIQVLEVKDGAVRMLIHRT